MAADIEALIDAIRADVQHQSGIALETEVRIVGEPVVCKGQPT